MQGSQRSHLRCDSSSNSHAWTGRCRKVLSPFRQPSSRNLLSKTLNATPEISDFTPIAGETVRVLRRGDGIRTAPLVPRYSKESASVGEQETRVLPRSSHHSAASTGSSVEDLASFGRVSHQRAVPSGFETYGNSTQGENIIWSVIPLQTACCMQPVSSQSNEFSQSAAVDRTFRGSDGVLPFKDIQDLRTTRTVCAITQSYY